MPIMKERFPQWMEAFVDTLSKQEVEKQKTVELKKEADINIKTLPKVVWNNTTFYVNLNEEDESAEVLNEYGIPVTTIKNVASVEDVDHHLNDNQIIASKKKTITNKRQDIFEEELRKATVYMQDKLEKSAGEFDATQQFGDPVPNSSPNTTNTNNTTTPQQPAAPQPPAAPQAPAPPNPTNQLDTAVETVDGVSAKKSIKVTKTAIKEKFINKVNTKKKILSKKENIKKLIKKAYLDKVNKSVKVEEKSNMSIERKVNRVNMEKKIDRLSKKVASLTKVIAELSDGLHAYTNPGNVYDTGAAEREVAHFNDTAENSKKVIDIENATDLTTPAGRTSLKRRILEELTAVAGLFDDVPADEELVVVEEPTFEEVSVEELPIDNLSEEELETLLSDLPEDEFVPIEIVDDTFNVIPDEEVTLREVELPNDDIVVVEEGDIPESEIEVKDKSDHDNAHGIDININDSENVDVNVLKHHDVDKKKKKLVDEENKEGSVKKLNKREASLFKHHICPVCHKRHIVKDKRMKFTQGLICKGCNTKFAVNLNSESIFKK